MTSKDWIELIIKIITFCTVSYFIFYKSWLKSLGNEMAKLTTREQLTKLEENVKKNFNEQLESYKSKLNEELSLKIEPLKSELSKNNITHQIQFSYLHQERGKVTLKLYKKLQELHSAMVSWTATLQRVIVDAEKEDEERAIRVNNAIQDFGNYYTNNKLFFSSEFCEFIDELFKSYWEKSWDFSYKKSRITNGEVTQEYFDTYTKEMREISNDVRDKLPEKIKELETKFRKLLNVVDEK
ncbi:hypothetical protein ACFFVB_16165 [Formosa undariae]|uniref:Uncharacterized protein n=1 Tax=Formosa undariae TaxID=1325436 RepID=A0ABV5F596_9FLAO